MLYSRVFFSAARDLSFKVRHRSVWGSASDSTGSATLLFDAQSHHLVIETADGNLSQGMRQLNGVLIFLMATWV
jgi:hypothetical protein